MLTPSRVLRAVSYSSTLKLPRSAFPPRPVAEDVPKYLQRCSGDLYAWQQSTRQGAETFVLHDGPPYANGSLHIGHALNKVLKDTVNRFQVLNGRRVHYVPGWDCHGLPIELKALQQRKAINGGAENASGSEASSLSAVEIRQTARQLATRTVEEQMAGFKQWAVMGDWANSYKTMDRDFELRQLRVFKQMVEKGLINRQFKPVHWSPSSGTALAEAELEYDEEHKSTAAFVKFPMVKLGGKEVSDTFVVIWTTTPWTLPANLAIAVNERMTYVSVELPSEDAQRAPERLLIARDRLEEVQRHTSPHAPLKIIDYFSGSTLAEDSWYFNPLHGLQANLRPIFHADFVSQGSGSGLVHLAPGHGIDDYNVCLKHGIQPFAPVDDQGCFTSDALPEGSKLLTGLPVQGAGTERVLDILRSKKVIEKDSAGSEVHVTKNHVLATHAYTHKYPIDWRTKQPVIIRATAQWFANVGHIRDGALSSLEGGTVLFLPDTGKSRLESFVKGRSGWCISRQRAWGVPIPALYRTDNGRDEAVMTPETIDHIIEIINKRGIDAWWTDALDDPAWIPAGLEGTYVRGKDTMDVWFDSGTSWTLLEARPDRAVADVYLEGSDQHRGWFQSSLLTHIASQETSSEETLESGDTRSRAPFGTLITHGFTLDEHGRKMSKSLGNVIAPHQIIDGTLLPPMKPRKQKGNAKQNPDKLVYDALGADALRLWVASSDYTRDVVIGQPVLQVINQNLHKYRITFKWMLGALSDFTPGICTDSPASPYTTPAYHLTDRLAAYDLDAILASVQSHYSRYEFFKVTNELNKYINNSLSASYFEVLKDRLYTGHPDDRYAAQSMLYFIFNDLLMMLAPITPLLVEEVWAYAPEALKQSIEHPARRPWGSAMPRSDEISLEAFGRGLAMPWSAYGQTDALHIKDMMTTVHSAIKIAQEKARAAKLMGGSLDCNVSIGLPEGTVGWIPNLFADEEELASAFVVSQVVMEEVEQAEGTIGERGESRGEWFYREYFDVPTDGYADGDKGTAKAVVCVRKPMNEKCPRCWRYAAEDEGHLCRRCDEVIDLLEMKKT